MARITIVGAGITGMATAALLSRTHSVTIIARNLPGDPPSIDWASPWAGAIFVAGDCSTAREKKMQLDSFAELWRWSIAYPESSLRRATIEDVYDGDVPESDVWWKEFMPKFRFLTPDELPEGAKCGTTYKTVVLNPTIFLPWLRGMLESWGVQFRRMDLTALSDARTIGYDILINATGVGSEVLADVRDADVERIRGQTIIVQSKYDKVFMRDSGKDYTYAIPRMDGTVILGGVRQRGSSDPEVDWDISRDIVRRLHESLPKDFSANLADYKIVGHNVGVRPGRSSGIRVEKEVKDGQKIVHAYGFSGGGYIHSFGAARAVRDLVEEFLFPAAVAKL